MCGRMLSIARHETLAAHNDDVSLIPFVLFATDSYFPTEEQLVRIRDGKVGR